MLYTYLIFMYTHNFFRYCLVSILFNWQFKIPPDIVTNVPDSDRIVLVLAKIVKAQIWEMFSTDDIKNGLRVAATKPDMTQGQLL